MLDETQTVVAMGTRLPTKKVGEIRFGKFIFSFLTGAGCCASSRDVLTGANGVALKYPSPPVAYIMPQVCSTEETSVGTMLVL